jgi:murein DD-endopeptidase MepM/ murein hydrolase activator NlpD
VRNSLRLFGLLTVLAGVNVYVFFFNRGTAPREVLRPASLVKGDDGKAGLLRESAAQAGETPGAASGEASDEALIPTAIGGAGAAAEPPVKSRLPVVLAPGDRAPTAAPGQSGKTEKGRAISAAAGASDGASPKGEPGGSPGVEMADRGEESPGTERKTIGASDTLGRLLAREGFGSDAGRVSAALSRLMDPRLMRGGQSYSVRLGEHGEPEAFEYRPDAATRFIVTRRPQASQTFNDNWIATRVDQQAETRIVSVSGSIESSLYESVQKSGEGSALAGLLVDLLAWDVNFYTDSHPGDYWKVTVEKEFLGDQFYRYGHIVAAEYGGQVGPFRAFYWKPRQEDAPGHYYDEKGQAIRKTLLKTPLRYVRVSSRFDRHRFHPILHREKAHLGIDYAAPAGTPIWASASGRILECQMERGSGNTVVIAHANGISTRYYHLKQFARGLAAGQLVRQKQVIGFVGTTGLSTGPHLHFSVTKNGAFVDPSKVQVNREAPVAERAEYLAAIRPRLANLSHLEPVLARN